MMWGFFIGMHFFYILYSKSSDTYYIGETEDLGLRVTQHNSGKYAGAFTTRASDWI
ncbi:MAG: GIY-YIG nuclease family protein [Bacteroidia bacterium]|nr:GIY-YIG nuclease family protein [Bacteroidia bacterium]